MHFRWLVRAVGFFSGLVEDFQQLVVQVAHLLDSDLAVGITFF